MLSSIRLLTSIPEIAINLGSKSDTPYFNIDELKCSWTGQGLGWIKRCLLRHLGLNGNFNNMKKSLFIGNVVVITGAASGIGRELALQLSRMGAWLCLADMNVESLERTRRDCGILGGRVMAVPMNITTEAHCKDLMDRAVRQYGRIDTLINNAGVTMVGRLDETTSLKPFEHVIRVNFMGSVYCTFYALPWLKKSRGRIVAVSSLAGKAGLPMRSAYSASKHAMAGFFDTLRIELADDGVSVTVVYPDFVATDLRKHSYGANGLTLKHDPVQNDKAMSVETCAAFIIKAVSKRKREVYMTFRGKLGSWLKLIAPKMIDRITKKAALKGR